MKTVTERIKQRLSKDRRMTTISLRVPQDVIDDLKDIAPTLGFSGYQPLMKAYIGQGLRKDLERLDGSQVQALTESLRKQGVADELISTAIAEAGLKTA
jgi:ERCC4-related helicase